LDAWVNPRRMPSQIIYGPVFSRRLGRSLGINLFPWGRKICSFDCVYCEHGVTDVLTLAPRFQDFFSAEDVLAAVENALQQSWSLDCLTFSGNGEPTLHPQFHSIAQAVRALRDRLRPEMRLAVFSNATTLHRPEIQQALALFDLPILKLDAGNEEVLQAVNRPAAGVTLATIVSGMKRIPHLVLQALFVQGRYSNSGSQAFVEWLELLAEIRPQAVQIYSLDRLPAQDGVEEVDRSRLEQMANEIRARTGLPVQVF
jgi:wyosine [tRNA(Phe)-imidazoG37] synthetase (radical SAM superfamily)